MSHKDHDILREADEILSRSIDLEMKARTALVTTKRYIIAFANQYPGNVSLTKAAQTAQEEIVALETRADRPQSIKGSVIHISAWGTQSDLDYE